MMKKRSWAIILASILIPALAHAAIEYKSIFKADISAPILDVATNPSENTVFVLTRSAVLIYSTEKQAVTDRIPLTEAYDHIAYQEPNRLVLSATKPARLNIIHFDHVYDIDVSGKVVQGPLDARAKLVIFDDYQCPYCSRLQPFVQEILDSFPQDVNCVIKDFPIASHPFSRQAAMAALAAERQGKFWAFHSQLLANYNRLNEKKIQDIAKNLGLDMKRFNHDRHLESLRKAIQQDVEEGRKLGVDGTPTVFLNGKRIDNRNLGRLPRLIKEELAK
jgi:protein-disulfide isomerase